MYRRPPTSTTPSTSTTSTRGWELVDDRFDAAANPNEAFRFGWVVEVDPMSRTAAPVKRTALGRFKHECATTIASKDGKAVVYSGDDARMEYMYKFVSAGTISGDKTTDMGLLDEGTLYVAKLEDDGTGSWMPLVHGDGPALDWMATALSLALPECEIVIPLPGEKVPLG